MYVSCTLIYWPDPLFGARDAAVEDIRQYVAQGSAGGSIQNERLTRRVNKEQVEYKHDVRMSYSTLLLCWRRSTESALSVFKGFQPCA